jgi:hypothetical protein
LDFEDPQDREAESPVETVIGLLNDLYRRVGENSSQSISAASLVPRSTTLQPTSRYEPEFAQLTFTEIQLRLMSALEVEMKTLKAIDTLSVLKFLLQYKKYHVSGGLRTLISMLLAEDGNAKLLLGMSHQLWLLWVI